ncbi:chaperonin 10-like protein [Absidia repens]|uniref:Chaperonin 10-like protein n=1 Tax=Absidia repens TaxID=90262 RepID=A0A1X2IW09_9FUNG|nr:chaperonin 10-like protein [Absidia repens]
MSTEIPTSMKALVLEQFGPPEALKYKTVPVPKLNKPTELLVRVVAASVNPVEAKLRSGNIGSFLVKKNAILGGDYSGSVVAKGSQVTEFEIGDAVFGTLRPPSGPQGSYAEYIVVDLQSDKGIAKKPDHVSFRDAAALGVAALTALLAVVLKAPLPLKYNGQGPRPKVLVIGASGGVGLYGVQVGKAIGAHVVGICSSKNASLVKSFGADRVVDYNDSEAMADLANNEKESFDVLFDLVGGEYYYKNFSPLVKKKTGVFASSVGPVAQFGSSKAGVFDYLGVGAAYAYRQLFAPCRYAMTLNLPAYKIPTDILYLLEQNLIKSYIPEENVFTLEEGYKAHQKIESHRTVGKIVLNISPDDFEK